MLTISSLVFCNLILSDDEILTLFEFFALAVATSVHGLDKKLVIVCGETINDIIVDVAKECISKLIAQIVNRDFAAKTVGP